MMSNINYFNRFFIISMVCILLVMVALTGCSNSNNNGNNTNNSNHENNANDEVENTPVHLGRADNLPLTTEPVTLSITTQDFGSRNISNDMELFKQLEKDTGVTIDWQAVQAANYKQSTQTRLAAGSDLTCMVKVAGDPIQYASDGLFIPLWDLIQEHTVYMKEYFETYPAAKAQYTAPDGKMYTLPQIARTSTANAEKYNHKVIMLRKDWLEKLNLDRPETVGDFYNVLKAFKEQDPNENGTQDEIPFTGAGLSGVLPLGWMYGLHLDAHKGFYPDENGRYVYEYMTPKMQELLVTLNKWYEEKLIDPAFLSVTMEKLQAQLFNDISGGVIFYSQAPYVGWDKQIQNTTGDENSGLVQIPTPDSPDGDAIVESATTQAGGHFAITNACEDPVLAIKWLDYVTFSPAGIDYNFFGLEGVSYEIVNGEKKFTDEFLNAKNGLAVEMNRIGARHHEQIPIVNTEVVQEFSFGKNYKKIKYAPQLLEQLQKSERIPPVMSTVEEADRLSELLPDIETFRDESIAKFITGNKPLDEFNDFVEKLKELGIEEVLEIKQQQYDRVTE